MGGEKLNMILFLSVVVMTAALQMHNLDAQKTHIVGGSKGWTYPDRSVDYSAWAATQAFAVGDVLVFNFSTGFHSVAEVTKEAYDSCNIDKTISRWTDGPAKVTLNSAGSHYYLCEFPGHCDAGQKLPISVRAADGRKARLF